MIRLLLVLVVQLLRLVLFCVDYGVYQTFTVLVNAGYKILDVLVDGFSVRPVDTYTLKRVLPTLIL